MSAQPARSDTASKPPPKKRSVVSNFIFKLAFTPSGKPQVALFRRSDKVSTYQHHLAPISGSIEPTDPSPLAAAWREISEETTLTPSNLTLLRQGKPYTFSDPSINREWTIHPFAFTLATPADEQRITIDWEHESWAWYDPLSVTDAPEFNGVPKLAESLRRVWLEYDLGEEASGVLAEGLRNLATDTHSGARQMAGFALWVLRGVVIAYDEPGLGLRDGCAPEKWWSDIRFAAWHLWKNGRESMGAAILAALLGTLGEMESDVSRLQGLSRSGSEISTEEFRKEILAIIDSRLAERQATADRITSSLLRYIASTFPSGPSPPSSPLTILTLSESSTITHALSHLGQTTNRRVDIRILESRPLFEGVSLASSLAKSFSKGNPNNKEDHKNAHKITLFTDASVALASAGVNLLLLGADRIASSGAASNKTGSLPAVLSVKHVTAGRAKVVVLGDTEKIALPGPPEAHVVEDNDPVQVSSAWEADCNSDRVRDGAEALDILQRTKASAASSTKVSVSNIFFEWVPPSLIDAYITELGEQTVEDIARHSEKLAEEERRIFGDL